MVKNTIDDLLKPADVEFLSIGEALESTVYSTLGAVNSSIDNIRLRIDQNTDALIKRHESAIAVDLLSLKLKEQRLQNRLNTETSHENNQTPTL